MDDTILDFAQKNKREDKREDKEARRSLVRRVLANRDLFPALLIIVVGVVSFGLGRLSVAPGDTASTTHLVSVSRENREGNTQGNTGEHTKEDTKDDAKAKSGASAKNTAAALSGADTETTAESPSVSGEKKYVASKNSTKYHLPWCSGAARIAEENKIWFSSKEEAKAAGYTPAANCKGI